MDRSGNELPEGLGFGIFGDDPNVYDVSYSGGGRRAECGDTGWMKLKLSTDKKILKMYVYPDESLVGSNDPKCPDGYQPPPFPDETQSPVLLTRTAEAPRSGGGDRRN